MEAIFGLADESNRAKSQNIARPKPDIGYLTESFFIAIKLCVLAKTEKIIISYYSSTKWLTTNLG